MSLLKTQSIVVSDETGLIKVINFSKDKPEIQKTGTQSRERNIRQMKWAGPAENVFEEVVVGCKSGNVEFWNMERAEVVHTWESKTENAIVGLEVLTAANDNNSRRLLTCTDAGIAKLVSVPKSGGTKEENDAMSDDNNKTTSSSKKGKKKGKKNTKKDKNLLAEWTVGKDLCTMRADPTEMKHFATAGNENLLRLWDIETQENIFKARNVPHDFLDMRVPYWVNDLAFMPNDPFKIATGTAHHQVRLYDTKAQKRPVFDVETGDDAIISVAITPDQRYIIAGDGAGKIQKYDIRHAGRAVGIFKGFGGSVTSLLCHPTLPLLASCSLDRYFRIHHLETRKPIQKIYLKQKLSNVLFWPQPVSEPVADEAEKKAAVEEEDDDLWAELEARSNKKRSSSKKKRKRTNSSDSDNSEDEEDDEDDVDSDVSFALGHDESSDMSGDDDTDTSDEEEDSDADLLESDDDDDDDDFLQGIKNPKKAKGRASTANEKAALAKKKKQKNKHKRKRY